MRIPRIYHPELITPGGEIALSDDAANHVGRVLRMGAGQAIQLFDGSNQVFDAEITRADKKSVHVKVLRGDGRPGIPAAHSPGPGDVAWGKDGVHHSEIH